MFHTYSILRQKEKTKSEHNVELELELFTCITITLTVTMYRVSYGNKCMKREGGGFGTPKVCLHIQVTLFEIFQCVVPLIAGDSTQTHSTLSTPVLCLVAAFGAGTIRTHHTIWSVISIA